LWHPSLASQARSQLCKIHSWSARAPQKLSEFCNQPGVHLWYQTDLPLASTTSDVIGWSWILPGPTQGRSWFLLSTGCDRGRYYGVAHGTGLIPNETQFPRRTLGACLALNYCSLHKQRLKTNSRQPPSRRPRARETAVTSCPCPWAWVGAWCCPRPCGRCRRCCPSASSAACSTRTCRRAAGS